MMIIHLGWMLPSTSSGYLGTRRAHLYMSKTFYLAPDGVYQAPQVTLWTGALLPHRFTCTTFF